MSTPTVHALPPIRVMVVAFALAVALTAGIALGFLFDRPLTPPAVRGTITTQSPGERAALMSAAQYDRYHGWLTDRATAAAAPRTAADMQRAQYDRYQRWLSNRAATSR